MYILYKFIYAYNTQHTINRPEDYKSKKFRNQVLGRSQAILPPSHGGLQPHKSGGDDKLEASVQVNLPVTPLAPAVFVLAVLAGIVVWQRKRQFDLKGYHKKRESDLPDC